MAFLTFRCCVYCVFFSLQRLVHSSSGESWHRFQSNAVAVRRFADGAYGSRSRLSYGSLIRVLGTGLDTPFFPSLRTLLIDVWHLRPPLLSPSVVVLAILICRPSYGDDYCVICACLNRAPPHLPNVSTLRLDGDAHLEWFHRPLARLCSSLPCLQVLTLAPSALSCGLLEGLSRCTSLVVVRVAEFGRLKVEGTVYEVGAQIGSRMPRLHRNAFPALREFSFNAATPRSVQLLITHPFYPSHRLTSLWIKFPGGAYFRPEDIKNLLLCLCDVCNVLERLTLRFATYVPSSYHDRVVSTSLGFSDICPFLSFPRLLHFAIDHSRPLVLTDQDVESIARGAGRFEVLWLNPFPPVYGPADLPTLPRIECLRYFSLHCPGLIRLGILMDACGRVDLTQETSRFLKLEELFVGWSRIDVFEDKDGGPGWEDLALLLSRMVSWVTVLSTVFEQTEEELRDLVCSDMRAMCHLTLGGDAGFARGCHAWRTVWGMALYLRSQVQ